MSKNKILKKDKVMTRGSGQYRAVLCYDSGLVYSYDTPERILAIYDKNIMGWVKPKTPYYSSGGWGSGSSGDALGHNLLSNTESLLNAISAEVYELNQTNFLTGEQIKKFNKEAEKQNRNLERMKKVFGSNVSKFEPLDKIKIEKSYRYNKNESKNKGLGIDVFLMLENYDKALTVFLERKGSELTIGDYKISKDRVMIGQKTVAIYDKNNDMTLNSEVLSITDFERNFLGSESLIQKTLREKAKYSIPFNVLESANLKLSETKVIEQGPESTHILGDYNKTERHFTGALLLENSGRKFLMDIDRIEIEHGIFNAFFVELSPQVMSISDAYESMKPLEVIEAEKNKVTVLRQGEWFLIETDKKISVPQDLIFQSDREDRKIDQGHVTKCNISHGKGRPNSLYKPVNFGELDQFFCGVVRHSGREHRQLDLKMNCNEDILIRSTEWSESKSKELVELTLYKVVGNTTVSNFTVTGEVD